MTAQALKLVRTRLAEVDNTIATLAEEDAALILRESVIERIKGRLENLERQIRHTLDEAAADLELLGIPETNLLKLEVSLQPLAAAAESARSRRDQISARLNDDAAGTITAERADLEAKVAELTDQLTAPERLQAEYQSALTEWDQRRLAILGSEKLPGTVLFLEERIREIERLPSRLRQLERSRRRTAVDIHAAKLELRNTYARYYGNAQRSLEVHSPAVAGSLALDFDVALRESGFAEEFLRYIHLGRTGSFKEGDGDSSRVRQILEGVDWTNVRHVVRFLRSLVRALKWHKGVPVDVPSQLRDGRTPEQLYNWIFGLSYMLPLYRLLWEGKGIEQLSPGERGHLLLIFYLLVDKDDIPLIIDQPEENLDNQSIVQTLVPSVRHAKARRQIILVTHNPNIAVVCDAEQVVHSELRKHENSRVVYTSGSIEEPIINTHILNVLEGTRPAFDLRDRKYLE